MKKILKTMLLTLGVFIAIAAATSVFAQDPPPPPPPGGGHGSGSNQTGGAAPLAGGIGMLLTMGAGYALKKLSDRHFASR